MDASPRLRLALAVVCSVLAAAPFLAVRFPPVADLPQHAAQVRLFLDAVSNPDSLYRVQWLTPYSLVYVVLGGCWAMVGPEQAGRVAMAVIAVLWTLAAHGVAAQRGRPVAAAVLASALVFNSSTYWGFLSFLMGWPAFLGWVLLTTQPLTAQPPECSFRARDGVLLVGVSLLLYFSHALWFAAGLAWLAASLVLFRPPWRVAAARLACAVPVTILAVAWYADFAKKFETDIDWKPPAWARFSLVWLTDATLGGLTGWIECVVMAAILVWIVLGVWQHRATIQDHVDGGLLACGLCFLAAAIVLPYKYENTIQFSSRWVAPGFILLLLALPPPALAPRLVLAGATATLAAFSLTTALLWRSFAQTELAGLDAALDALPPAQRVLGLDFAKTSLVIKGRPFLQTAAYAQVVRGGRLSFSFAEFPPMLVVFKEPPKRPWTLGLEWYAEWATADDMQHFDYVLANGPPEVLDELARRPELEAMTQEGQFRLYRVKPRL